MNLIFQVQEKFRENFHFCLTFSAKNFLFLLKFNFSVSTHGKLTIPYNVRGMLNMCSPQKQFSVKSRILLYHKYDSYPVDCVKSFIAPGRNLAFRFLLVSFIFFNIWLELC